MIDSPGRPYRSFLDCLWDVEIPFGGQVRIFFTQFNTEKIQDVLVLGNGTDSDDEDSVILRASGRERPKDIIGYARNLWLRFTTDSVNEMSGWTVVIEAMPYTGWLASLFMCVCVCVCVNF